MTRRRFTKDPIVRPVGRPRKDGKPAGSVEEKPIEQGFKTGAENPKYVTGAESAEIKLPQDAFVEMLAREDEYNKLIDEMAKERNWSPLKVLSVKEQAARVVRMRAIIRSNAVRMTTEKLYRKKVQETTGTESVFRYEAAARKESDILDRMLGLDEMHEAKLGQAEAKSKPTDFKVIVGGNMNKAHMAAAGGDDGEDD